MAGQINTGTTSMDLVIAKLANVQQCICLIVQKTSALLSYINQIMVFLNFACICMASHWVTSIMSGL